MFFRAASLFAIVALLSGAASAQAGRPRTQSQTITITGGVEGLLQPDLSLEFKLVPTGQSWVSAGVPSAAAVTGFLNNDCTFGGTFSNCAWSPLGSSTPVDFSISIIPLTEAQVDAYNQGAGAFDGPPIQFPLYGVTLAIPVVNSAITANGSLVMGDGELCGIFSGQITDWSQFSYKAAPGPFHIVYDTDVGSGATWLLTQHLAAVCDATNSAFTTLPVPVTGDFSTLPVPGGVAGNSHFVGAAKNAGMQTVLLGSGSAIGYIGPNFTSERTGSPVTSKLVVASLYNVGDGTAHLPDIPDGTIAFHNPGPGAMNVMPPATQATAADPVNWVPLLPAPAKGYPIVGYANWILSTCYLTISSDILQYLTAPPAASKHIQTAAAQGLQPLSMANPAFATAVSNILLSNADGYQLQIQNPVACHGRTRMKPDVQ